MNYLIRIHKIMEFNSLTVTYIFIGRQKKTQKNKHTSIPTPKKPMEINIKCDLSHLNIFKLLFWNYQHVICNIYIYIYIYVM